MITASRKPAWKKDIQFNIFGNDFIIRRKDGLEIVYYPHWANGENWYIWRIGGTPQESYTCHCEHDCCGHSFCRYAYPIWFQLGTFGAYGINI